MIYFDKKTLALLRYIKRRGDRGVSWADLREKFGNDAANILLLESLSKELYTVTKGHDGNWLDFDAPWDHHVYGDFRSFCSPKGNELLELRCFNFWKWIIPMVISIASLIVSVIAALN